MKRFTETEKWRDPWFRKLSAGAKLAFLYILDNCDGAGVWGADKELADFSIGMTVPWEKVAKDFADRLEILSDGKWLLTKFIEFQYGELSPDCKPHLSVIRLIEKHKIKTVLKGYSKGMDTLEEKEKDKDKEKDKKGNVIFEIPEILKRIPEFESQWIEFCAHRKEIKKPLTLRAGNGILKDLCERPAESVEALKTAVRRSWQGFEWAWIDKDKSLANGSNGNGKPKSEFYG